MYKLGLKVKEVRKDLGLTQELFSKKIGITRGYLSDIERGRIKGTVELINKLSDISGKPMAYFTDEDFELKQYEILDSTIDMLINAGEIKDSNISPFAKEMLTKVLLKEIELKQERKKTK